ncbi:hypothetical protein PM082_001193 [Marasmius tenuissimus]|nr:hypothetical protein PM082_001193 [Marasmius tenuissimus]
MFMLFEEAQLHYALFPTNSRHERTSLGIRPSVYRVALEAALGYLLRQTLDEELGVPRVVQQRQSEVNGVSSEEVRGKYIEKQIKKVWTRGRDTSGSKPAESTSNISEATVTYDHPSKRASIPPVKCPKHRPIG